MQVATAIRVRLTNGPPNQFACAVERTEDGPLFHVPKAFGRGTGCTLEGQTFSESTLSIDTVTSFASCLYHALNNFLRSYPHLNAHSPTLSITILALSCCYPRTRPARFPCQVCNQKILDFADVSGYDFLISVKLLLASTQYATSHADKIATARLGLPLYHFRKTVYTDLAGGSCIPRWRHSKSCQQPQCIHTHEFAWQVKSVSRLYLSICRIRSVEMACCV